MAKTLFNLDRQAEGKIFVWGTESAGGDALITINKGTQPVTTIVLDVKGSQSIAGDLNLLGNLNVTGNINSVSVTNTNVADITITLNDGGSTATANGAAGINVEGDTGAIIGRLVFDNTLTSKWKIGDGSAQVEIVTISGAQTLTNKSIAGSQITGNISGNAGNVSGVVLPANGGTGLSSLTAYGLIAAGTTSTGNFQQIGLGTSGHVLTSNGPGALPTFQAIAASSYWRWTTVSGTQDGVNKSFTIGNAVSAGSEIVSVNGQVLNSGASNDYVLSGTTLTFQAAFTAPAASDIIKVGGVY